MRKALALESNMDKTKKNFRPNLNKKKLYVLYTLEILKMLPIENSQLIGFEGRFIGTLYNTENVNDSIQIKSKSLKFLQINRHDYQQCL